MAYVIKRYSNRKLYDTQESRYVTLEEIEEMIRAGREISVVDAASGEDLTSVTLTQIILENERNHRARCRRRSCTSSSSTARPGRTSSSGRCARASRASSPASATWSGSSATGRRGRAGADAGAPAAAEPSATARARGRRACARKWRRLRERLRSLEERLEKRQDRVETRGPARPYRRRAARRRRRLADSFSRRRAGQRLLDALAGLLGWPAAARPSG